MLEVRGHSCGIGGCSLGLRAMMLWNYMELRIKPELGSPLLYLLQAPEGCASGKLNGIQGREGKGLS